MTTNITTMTAPTPSFGMPVYGAAFVTPACSGSAIKRARHLGGTVVDVIGVTVVTDAATKGAFPGTTAWRPPSC